MTERQRQKIAEITEQINVMRLEIAISRELIEKEERKVAELDRERWLLILTV